jgi:hypothetical protein
MRDMPPLELVPVGSLRPRVTSAVLLLLPTIILGMAAGYYELWPAAGGALLAFVAALGLLRHRYVWRPPTSWKLILLYVFALIGFSLLTRTESDGFARVGRGILLLTIVALFVSHDLNRSGVEARRRGRELCRKLLRRVQWPASPAEYWQLSEVRELAEVLQDDPSPAVQLLHDPRPEVRLAAFTALQQRPFWRIGEAELILATIHRSTEPHVRAAGLACLKTLQDGELLVMLSGYLRDRSSEVRAATLTTLLANTEGHWPLIRDAIRDCLADASLAKDGALKVPSGSFCGVAVCDLTSWTAEAAPLGTRSLQTLIEHYGQVLSAAMHPELPAELSRQITDPTVVPVLRVELAHLLRSLGLITPELLDRMTDIDQPGPLRILAAEMLLTWNPNNPDAIDVLRGLGRQSNRETVLAIARLLQKYLHLDMGLTPGSTQANTKQAAEVAKRVFTWATGKNTPPIPPPTADAGSAWVQNPIAGPALPGLKNTSLASSQEMRRKPG